jgi:hypothetical protein
MGHGCGPKLSKVEFLNVQNGKPCPKVKCSDIARDLEKANGTLGAEDIYVRIGEKLREAVKKRKELETRIIPPTS